VNASVTGREKETLI